jgi:hypothetical protein
MTTATMVGTAWTTVPWHFQPSLAYLLDDKDGSMVGTAWTTVPWHFWPSLACLLDDKDGSGDSADNSALASLAISCLLMQRRWRRQRCQRRCLGTVGRPLLACMTATMLVAQTTVPQNCWPSLLAFLTVTMAAAAAIMTVPWHCWLSLACSCNNGGSSGSVDNIALALSTVPACLLEDNKDSSSGKDDSALEFLTISCLLMQ